MGFKLREYTEPNFNEDRFIKAPNASVELVIKDGVAPDNYHANSIYPEYFKVNDKWVLAKESRMDCVVRINENDEPEVVEFRKLKVGDKVVVGRTEDASEGIYLYPDGFYKSGTSEQDVFAFRSGRSRETSYTKDYENLYDLLKYEKENGYIVWVLGPAAVFAKGARDAMAELVNNGYVDAFFGGNAVATHDLEAGMFHTALGQDIYTQEYDVYKNDENEFVNNDLKRDNFIESLYKQRNGSLDDEDLTGKETLEEISKQTEKIFEEKIEGQSVEYLSNDTLERRKRRGKGKHSL